MTQDMKYTQMEDFVQRFRWCPACERIWDPLNSRTTVTSTLKDPATVLKTEVCRRHIQLDPALP